MSSSQGAISENVVINDLLTHGCKVYKEVTGGGEVDLIVDSGKRLLRIQVKTASGTHGVLGVSLERRWRGTDGNWVRAQYTSDTVDVMAVVHGNMIAYVPVSKFGEQITMAVRYEPPRNGKTKSMHTIDEFSFEKTFSV
jgi:Holliday junction resolvase-like predicted endonuclease